MAGRSRASRRDLLRRVLRLGESPERSALAYGIGVFLSFSPFWGLHTVLGIAVAFALRLNRLAVLVGVYTNTPLTFAPAASLGTALGFFILGKDGEPPEVAHTAMFSAEFWRALLDDVEELLLPFFVGNLVLSLAVGTAAFFVMRWILVRNDEPSAHAQR